MLPFVLALLMLFSSCLPPGALAYEESYMPLPVQILSRRLKQTRLAELEAGEEAEFGGTKIMLSKSGVLQAHGIDKSGKPWSFISNTSLPCASIWQADLDKNSIDDLIVLTRTHTEIWLPGSSLTFLMFEQNGRPFPWSIDGYFEADSRGIKDLLLADRNRRACLISQSFDDGYWMTSIYTCKESRWQKLERLENMPLPLYTRFTLKPNQSIEKPSAICHPHEADFSNNNIKTPESSGVFIESVELPPQENPESISLKFSDGKRLKKKSGTKIAIVLDEKSMRKCAVLSTVAPAQKLLNEIAYKRLPVSLSFSKNDSSKLFIYACRKEERKQNQLTGSKIVELP